MSDFTHVYFEGLGIDFNLPSVAFTIGNHDVKFYGIIIAFGFTLAVLYGGRGAYKWKMSLDGMTDVLIWGTIFGIIGARIYYVAFEWDYYSMPEHFKEIPMIWNGGIAIYGGIIGALLGAAIGCKIGKINFLNLLDFFKLGVSSQYRDRVFIHQVGTTLSVRVIQIDVGVSSQSSSFKKSMEVFLNIYGHLQMVKS